MSCANRYILAVVGDLGIVKTCLVPILVETPPPCLARTAANTSP